MKKCSLLFFLAITMLSIVQGQKVIRLYPGKAPGSEKWNWQEGEKTMPVYFAYNVVVPTLTAYLPDTAYANGTAVIICPGGGFQIQSIDGEGIQVAKWLNAKGIAAFVLKYRLMQSVTENPWTEMNTRLKDLKKFDQEIDSVVTMAIADGRKAIEYVKQHAGEYHIAPNRIGMMGFSAGGTVTMGVGFSFQKENRPDFLVPVYPYMNPLKNQNVLTDAPPIFICAATDDPLGIASQCSNLYNQWITAGKSAELHLYAKGRHGFGLGKPNLPVSTWTERLEEWLAMQGLLTASTQ